MTITQDTPVSDIATQSPASVKVLQRYGIDFCCGGGRPLKEACEKRHVDAGRVLSEIALAQQSDPGDQVDWREKPLGALVGYIVARYHAPLRDELLRLEGMAIKVHRVHGHKEPVKLLQLADAVSSLREELLPHLEKEERVLFPAIQNGRGQATARPIEVMEDEHVSCGQLLEEIRALTSDFVIPDGACNTWRALWQGLEALDADLKAHIHLENNILFPRALEGDAA